MKKEHDIKNLVLASDTLEYFPSPRRHFIANNIDLWISHTIQKGLMSTLCALLKISCLKCEKNETRLKNLSNIQALKCTSFLAYDFHIIFNNRQGLSQILCQRQFPQFKKTVKKLHLMASIIHNLSEAFLELADIFLPLSSVSFHISGFLFLKKAPEHLIYCL